VLYLKLATNKLVPLFFESGDGDFLKLSLLLSLPHLSLLLLLNPSELDDLPFDFDFSTEAGKDSSASSFFSYYFSSTTLEFSLSINNDKFSEYH